MRVFICGLALSATVLAGCQATVPLHAMKQPVFALGQDDAKLVEVDTSSSAVAGVAGRLTVNFARDLSQLKRDRRVLATIADVEKVVVTVKPAGAAEVSQTVLKAAITAGQTTVNFQSLPPGKATVTITAFDASDVSIGSVVRTATVVAGQVTTIGVTLQLDPTYLPPGGGGSTSTVGGLVANVTIQDGAIAKSLPGGGVQESYQLPFFPMLVAVDSQGYAWVVGAPSIMSSTSTVAKLSPTGAIERMITVPNLSVGAVAIDAADHIWIFGLRAEDKALFEYGTSGDLIQTHVLPAGFDVTDNIQIDETGRIYSNSPFSGLWSWSATGEARNFWIPGNTIELGAQDDIWVGVIPDTSDVARFSRTGVELGRYSVGAGYRSAYTAIDSEGNAWVTAMSSDPIGNPRPGRLVKFAANGQAVGTYQLSNGQMANAVEVGPDGKIWVVSGGGFDGTVTWFTSDGIERGHVALTNVHPWQFAVGQSGAWVIDHEQHAVTRIAP